jgi:GNAT superfamily N-acetyltransferase
MRAHLKSLDERDRYLRFGYPALDEHIDRYVDSIDFARDEVFGIFNRRVELVALAHLATALPASAGGDGCTAEFGVSVRSPARGRGLGAHLFDRAVLHARNRGVMTLIIHALGENTAMLRLATRAGAIVRRDGPDAQAKLQLLANTLTSHVDALVEDRAAEVDYFFKRRFRRRPLAHASK